MWTARPDTAVETAEVSGIRDPLAAAVDSRSGTICVLVGTSLKVIPGGGPELEIEVPEAESLEAFFTPGAGRKCPATAKGSHVLILGKKNLLVVDIFSKEVRQVAHDRWCLCTVSEGTVFFADEKGCTYSTEHGLEHPAFPGEMTLIHHFPGVHTPIDGNCLEPVRDFVEDPKTVLKPRDSGSVLGAMCALPGTLLVCQGHGLQSFQLGGSEAREILKDQRSASSFAFPSALYVASEAVFAQCFDGIRQTSLGGTSVSLALPAGEMVFEDDSGSPHPYPQDFIGIDSDHLYFLVERDWHVGMALRRWPHGQGKAAAEAVSRG